jgi:hypothetical protein
MTLLRRRRPTNLACTNCEHGRGPWLTLCVKTQLHAVPFCNVATKKCTSGPNQPMCWSLLGSARKAVSGFFFSPSVFIHARYTAYPELLAYPQTPTLSSAQDSSRHLPQTLHLPPPSLRSPQRPPRHPSQSTPGLWSRGGCRRRCRARGSRRLRGFRRGGH